MAANKPSILGVDDHWVAPPDFDLASPSPLRATVQMFIHSHDALRLLAGRPASEGKSAIIGLFGFAECLREVWGAAKLSDPYAWWWLTKTEEAHAAAQLKIKLQFDNVRQALAAVPELDVNVAASDSPSRIDLNFACPYAYWGARVIKSYDKLILAVTTAERLGLRPRAAYAANRLRCERSIRGLFASAQGFRSIGVNADEIKNGTDAANQARELMGPLPASVLSGERFPALLPNESRPAVSASEQ